MAIESDSFIKEGNGIMEFVKGIVEREKYLDYALILTIALCIVIFIEPRY